LVFLEKISKQLDDGRAMDIIYLDFSKAFDKVPHQRLLNKMKSLGIKGNILRWTENWLLNRKQRTVLNGSFSDWAEVKSGVPQGSVLGPLLFIIFINDIDECAKDISILLKFADDTKISNEASSEANCALLQNCLDQLLQWADTWCMSFNTSKCKVLHVGRNNICHRYNMDGSILEETVRERDIGVIITNNLKPAQQCLEAARRAGAVLTQISRAFLYRDKKVFIQLYKQFVRCHLEFAVPAWSPWLIGDIDVLERVQKRAVNLVVGLVGRTYEEKLTELGLNTLKDRRIQIDLIQTFKILKGIDRVDPDTWFNIVGDNVTRLTRNTAYEGNLLTNRSNTDQRKNFFTNRVIPIWNALPTELKNSRNVKIFKTGIEKVAF